ncbi:MAG: hydrogenase small subunit [Magnetovibrionaceae bacterium]
MPDTNHEIDFDALRDEDLDGYKGALGGLTRRDFLKYCTGIAATLGLAPAFGVKIADAATAPQRPPVIWLHGQECTGCTESMLRSYHPTLESLIMETISLDYHETLCAGAGHQAEAHKKKIMEEYHGKYVLVVEGATPAKDGGIYCKIGGETMLNLVKEAGEGAAAVIAMGSCSSWGGVQSAAPNPTGAISTPEVLTDKTVITIPGCPPSPYNFLSTVLHLLTFGKAPDLDAKGRPKFAYGRLIHENCERRPHFDAGRFAMEFGDEGHRKGYCLYKIGCKGPETHGNCSVLGFGDVGESAWPVGTGHPCFGCTEKATGFNKSIHTLASVQGLTPPAAYPGVAEPVGQGISPAAAAAAAGAVGAAVGAAGMAAVKMKKEDAADD